MQKIKENGSLYAVPSTNETSDELEMLELMERMDPIIEKPDNLFKEKQINGLYKKFKGEINRIKKEERMAKKEKQKNQDESDSESEGKIE